MKTQVKIVEPQSILRFINERPISILRAGRGLELEFNLVLSKELEKRYGNTVNLGRTDISKIDLSNPAYKFFYDVWMQKLGLRKSKSVLPGYYIFIDGSVVGYHPGTLESIDFDDKLNQYAGIAALFTGFFVGIFTKNIEEGFKAFSFVLEVPQAMKILNFIAEVVGNRGAQQKNSRQAEIFESELEKAYKLLKVSPNSTNEEIQKARKKLMKKYHPDLHLGEAEKYNRICAEINNAYDLIIQYRSGN